MMASSMLSGERRGVSARRGMCVLGKVPKPVNLPSERLENHGLDPNVEIVPKGTLSWGSRPSSSTPNPWGSSAMSPYTNGTSGSPAHLNGRPSSGGSGTRPSTAGSDRSHEPAASAWSSNSRPSSASGLTSNQTSVASPRPRSADTRPGSSQLSRFAESVAENSGPWGGPGTAEKLGTSSSRSNEFTLSSGDFPTLGSEKSSELSQRQGHSSHGRPGSGNGGATAQKERSTSPTDGSVDASEEKINVNTWRKDTSPYHGGGTPPSMDKWHRDPQPPLPYPNPNMPPHHFEPWHGTPIRSPPDTVWYRGGQPGGPYGSAGPPCSYPLEPFGYYQAQLPARPMLNSQIPARPVPNSQVGPRPGARPSGYHPNPGETYRPRMPDSYSVPSHPVMTVRPGIYPGPVPYDGYYGPPRMSFCNPNEKDVPALGTGPPHGYNRFQNQNAFPDPVHFHARPGPYGPSPAMTKEQVESGHAPDSHRGPYKVLLKQHDVWGENDTEEKREHSVTTSEPHSERGNTERMSVREIDWETDHRNDERVDFSKTVVGEEASSHPINNQRGPSLAAAGNLPDSRSKVNAVDERVLKKPEPLASPAEGPQHFPFIKKDAALIDKIEGLNTKARISDGRNEAGSVSAREEKTKRFRTGNVKADHSAFESGRNTASREKSFTDGTPTPTSMDVVDASIADEGLELTVGGRVLSKTEEPLASSVRMLDCSGVGEKAHSPILMGAQGTQVRAAYKGKGRFNNEEGEEWRKRPPGAESSFLFTATNADPHLETRLQDRQGSQEVLEKEESNPLDKAGGEPCMTSSVDSTDYKAQREKMKELAMQRAKQLQKEEEERTREQKAKALAKLEELNRRTMADNVLTQKLESNAAQHEQEESLGPSVSKSQTGISVLGEGPSGCNSDAAIQGDENGFKLKESTELSLTRPPEASSSLAPQDPVVAIESSVSVPQDANTTGIAAEKTGSQLPSNGSQKQKQMGYKRKQNNSLERNLSDKTAPIGVTRVQGNLIVNVIASTVESGVHSITNDDHPQQQQKKKNNRVAKNKQKTDDPSLLATLQSPEPAEGNAPKDFTESKKPKAPETVSAASSVKPETSRAVVKGGDSHEEVVVSADQGWSQPIEEAHGRMNHQWKAQPHRRVSRNTQSNRPVERFHGNESTIWAPVRPVNKSEPFEESNQNNVESGRSSVKSGHGMQSNSTKGKRAEMERYVPKPVAKELSQQENSQLPSAPSAPSTQAISDMEMVKLEHSSQSTKNSGVEHLADGKARKTVETKNVEVKQHKNGKTNASWRQRGPVDSYTVLPCPHEGPSSSADTGKTVQKSVNQQQVPDVYDPKEQEKYSDGWNMDWVPTGPVAAPIVVKDHGGAGRGKRQHSRAHRSSGQSHAPGDRKYVDIEPVDKTNNLPLTFGSIDMDGTSNSRNENQAVGEHASSHWQPKSQVHSSQNHQGRRGNGGQRLPVQMSKIQEKESSNISPQLDKDIIAQAQPHQPDTQKANVEMNSPYHEEAKQEVKGLDSSKEHANSPNRGAPRSPEVASENVSIHHEQPVSMGMRRQGQHNGRFNRGQETPYGGGRGSLGQDASKQQLPINGDRRKHGSHYEYQPVGSYSKTDNLYCQEEARETSHAMGSRYRERGQNHPRRGAHYYGRNSGGASVRVAAAFGDGD